VFLKNNQKWAMEKSPQLKILTNYQKDLIISQVKNLDIKQDEVIFKKDQLCDRIFLTMKTGLYNVLS